MRKDEAIYQDVIAHPYTNDRSVENIAHRLRMEPYEVRLVVHQSKRLAMRGVLLGWHVVEIAKEHSNADSQSQRIRRHGPGTRQADREPGRESSTPEERRAPVDEAGS